MIVPLLQTAAIQSHEPLLTWTDVAKEYLQFVGYFLAIGAVGFRYLIRARVRRAGSEVPEISGTVGAALGLIGVLLILTSALGGIQMEAMLHHKSFAESLPKAAARFEFKIITLLAALIGFTLARRLSAKAGWPLAALGILLAALQPVVTSRFGGKVNAVHVLAASTWLGTLTVMLIAGIRRISRAAEDEVSKRRTAARVVNAFTPVALTAASIVALSGVTTAWLHLKRLPALWESAYGRALMVKLCVVAAVVTMGWWNWKRVKPSLGNGDDSVARLERSATTEVILAAFVLVATAVLVSLPSPK